MSLPEGAPGTAYVEVEALRREFDVSRPWLARVIERQPRQILRAVEDCCTKKEVDENAPQPEVADAFYTFEIDGKQESETDQGDSVRGWTRKFGFVASLVS